MTDWQAIRADYESGQSLRDIVASHGSSIATISRVARREGWIYPPRKQGDKEAWIKPALNHRQEYEQGASLRDIAARYGGSIATISRVARREGWVRPWVRPVEPLEIRKQRNSSSPTYKVRTRKVSGSHTTKQVQEQLKRQKCRCYYCKAKFEQRYIYHVEHTFPLSRANGNDPINTIDYIVLACPTCNLKKGNKYPWEWPEGGKLL